MRSIYLHMIYLSNLPLIFIAKAKRSLCFAVGWTRLFVLMCVNCEWILRPWYKESNTRNTRVRTRCTRYSVPGNRYRRSYHSTRLYVLYACICFFEATLETVIFWSYRRHVNVPWWVPVVWDCSNSLQFEYAFRIRLLRWKRNDYRKVKWTVLSMIFFKKLHPAERKIR